MVGVGDLPLLSDLLRSWAGQPSVVWKHLSSVVPESSLSGSRLHVPLPAGFSLGRLENESIGKLLFPVVNVFHARCVPLRSSSGQLPSCRVLLLSTAGGPCL